ncbi:MAG TPA: hypothetical protein VK737_09820 [Opitutales bacterium]|jgi:hypothetical protein|nr:hypothetical protein [Opitutales bacterium]
MKIRLGQLELARGLAHRESPHHFSLATARATQIAPALRAPLASVFDRGNAHTSVAFAITRRHDSVERALRFAATHPQALASATGGLTFISEDGPGEAEIFLPDAALRSVRCLPAGLVTDTEYEFIGSALTCQPST